MEELGVARDYCVECLKARKRNQVTATYQLLLQRSNRRQRQQQQQTPRQQAAAAACEGAQPAKTTEPVATGAAPEVSAGERAAEGPERGAILSNEEPQQHHEHIIGGHELSRPMPPGQAERAAYPEEWEKTSSRQQYFAWAGLGKPAMQKPQVSALSTSAERPAPHSRPQTRVDF